MARKIKAKLVLKLRAADHSRCAIARTQGMSKRSAIDVFDAADEVGVDYDDVADSSNEEVYSLLLPDRNVREDMYADPDWECVYRELVRTPFRSKWRPCSLAPAQSPIIGGTRFLKRGG